MLLLPMAVSCMRDDLPDRETTGDADAGIAVSATVTAGGNTRAYIESGELVTDTYYMIYYKKNGSSGTYRDSNAYVDFGYNNTTEDPATGYAYYMAEDGTTRKDLKWRDIYGEGQSAQTFYLSNLDPKSYTYHSSSSGYWSHFKPTPTNNNPYVASPLDEEMGTNDIIAGSVKAKAGEKLEFELKHILALLKINIEVYSSTEGQQHYVNLSNAKVSISNLATDVVDINFLYPTVFKYHTSYSVSPGLGDNCGYYTNIRKDENPIVMVDPENADKYGWAKGFDGTETTDGCRVYSTRPFIMPPQPIPPTTSTATNVINRPRLVVEVPTRDATGAEGATGTTTYSGYIPTVMFDVDEDGNIRTDSSPEDIALRSGYQLTITATINSPNTELIFAPVKIERWVGKGDYTFKLKQAGIYNAVDFNDFITTYNDIKASADKNWALLEKFGYVDETGHLVIQTWASVMLDLGEIEGRIAIEEGHDFSFVFNGYTITLTEQVDGEEKPREIGELYGREGQAKLYKIVTDPDYDYRSGDHDETFSGIESEEELLALIDLFDDANELKLEDLVKYGALNNMNSTLVFDITDSFDVNLPDILRKIPETILGYAVSFTMESGVKVRVGIPSLPDDEERGENGEDYVIADYIECESSESIEKLLVNRAYGIRTAEDLYLLIHCYNELYTICPELLTLFGTEDASGKWTFYLLNAITVYGDKVFVSMVPDPDNGRPDYTMSGTYYVTYLHDALPFRANSYFYYILSGKGAATRNSTLSDIVTSYNNTNKDSGYQNLWYYGRFDVNNNKWIFPLTYTDNQQYVSYSGLFGKMIRDDADGKYDYEFIIGGYANRIEVRSMPDSDEAGAKTSSHYFYQDGSDNSDYPNSAADLKRVADGTYWEYFRAERE